MAQTLVMKYARKVLCQMVDGLKVGEKKTEAYMEIKKVLDKNHFTPSIMCLCAAFPTINPLYEKGSEKKIRFIISMLSEFSSGSQVIKAFTCIRKVCIGKSPIFFRFLSILINNEGE